MEPKTARLTILIDPKTKTDFEDVCRTQDITPSQMVRRLIRTFLADRKIEGMPRRIKR